MLLSAFGFVIVVLMASAVGASNLTAKEGIDLQMFEVDVLKFCGLRGSGSFEHPKDCRKVIQCESYVGTVVHCDSGAMYNPAWRGCEPTFFTSCKDRDFYCTKVVGDKNWMYERSEEPIDSEPFGFNDANDRATYTPGTFACPGTNKVTRSAKEGCKKFNTCINGRPFVGECSEGSSFDVRRMICLPTEQAVCKLAVICGDGALNGVYATPGFCDRFAICCNRQSKVIFCPKGLLFDSVKMICVPSEKATCVPGGGGDAGFVRILSSQPVNPISQISP